MIIFGLGNPGLKYHLTRHNAGYIFVDELARSHKKKFIIKRGYKKAIVNIEGRFVELIKPLCWMNHCGVVVAKFLKEKIGDFLIVVDDLNLPIGKIRLRRKGSDGGHLGLRSIIDSLNSEDFPRLRIGIGRSDTDAASYVLSRFKRSEKRILISTMREGIKGIKIMIKDGFIKGQNYINSINIEFDSDR